MLRPSSSSPARWERASPSWLRRRLAGRAGQGSKLSPGALAGRSSLPQATAAMGGSAASPLRCEQT
eukprot:15461776-Alexandrium_andersonii.AAC.1